MKAVAFVVVAAALAGCAGEGNLVSLRADLAKQAEVQRKVTQTLSDRVAQIEGNANACVAGDAKTGKALEKVSEILSRIMDRLAGAACPECPSCSP